eukprot:Polyplicarium_translucidae@DN3118_c0_g2_i3.p1
MGCMVDSCGGCKECERLTEEYCPRHMLTYNSLGHDGVMTYGGYSREIVVREKFVFRMPTNLDFAASAPLLCAGITTYSPMKRWNADSPGKKIGVVGLGGLGHM